MMWRVWHHIFGWHFVVYENCIHREYVRRVRFAADGTPYISALGFVWLLDPSETPRWRALTFNKSEWIAAQAFDTAGHHLPKIRSAA